MERSSAFLRSSFSAANHVAPTRGNVPLDPRFLHAGASRTVSLHSLQLFPDRKGFRSRLKPFRERCMYFPEPYHLDGVKGVDSGDDPFDRRPPSRPTHAALVQLNDFNDSPSEVSWRTAGRKGKTNRRRAIQSLSMNPVSKKTSVASFLLSAG